MHLKGKVIIITGAAKGIGRAITVRVSAEGASAALVDIDEEGVSKLASELSHDNRP